MCVGGDCSTATVGGPTLTRPSRRGDKNRIDARCVAWLANRSLLMFQASEGWYRYGDSNPGPVAENHVS